MIEDEYVVKDRKVLIPRAYGFEKVVGRFEDVKELFNSDLIWHKREEASKYNAVHLCVPLLGESAEEYRDMMEFIKSKGFEVTGAHTFLPNSLGQKITVIGFLVPNRVAFGFDKAVTVDDKLNAIAKALGMT